MKRSSKFRWVAVWLSAFFLFGAAAFSSYKDLGLPTKHFPASSPYYTVTEISEDPAAPGFLKFHLTAPHGNYVEEGLVNLKKAAHEIEVLETLVESEPQGGFKEGVNESIQDTSKGLQKLINHPKESARDIQEAGRVIGRMIQAALREKDPGEKTSLSEKVTGFTKRDLARKMAVDAYSRNPYLQEKLDEMTRVKMKGEGAAMIGRMLIPVGKLVSLTLTAGSLNQAADELVDDLNREELFQMNLGVLVGAGYPEEAVRAFLNHPCWTPREATYFRYGFEKLKGVPGTLELLKTAGNMKEGIRAYQFLYEVQMAAEKFNGNPQNTEIRSFPEGMALKQGGKLFWITAYDYLDAGDLGQRVINKAGNVKSERGCHSLEILNGGKVTLGFAAASLIHGIPSKGMVLFEEEGLPAE